MEVANVVALVVVLALRVGAGPALQENEAPGIGFAYSTTNWLSSLMRLLRFE
jgi:hypothetical protein